MDGIEHKFNDQNRGHIHYNKRCPCMPNDFIGFRVNSLVVVNGDQ
jgi:hypothetical protein